MQKIIGILFTIVYVVALVFQGYCLFANIAIALDEYDNHCPDKKQHYLQNEQMFNLSDLLHNFKHLPNKIHLETGPSEDAKGNYSKLTVHDHGIAQTCTVALDRKELVSASQGHGHERSKIVKPKTCNDGSEPTYYFVTEVNIGLLCCNASKMPNQTNTINVSTRKSQPRKIDSNNTVATTLDSDWSTKATPTEEEEIGTPTTSFYDMIPDYDTVETDDITTPDNRIQFKEHGDDMSDIVYDDDQFKSSSFDDVAEANSKDEVSNVSYGDTQMPNTVPSTRTSINYQTTTKSSEIPHDPRHKIMEREAKFDTTDEMNQRDEKISKKPTADNQYNVTDSEIVINVRRNSDVGKGIQINSNLLDEEAKKILIAISKNIIGAGHTDDDVDLHEHPGSELREGNDCKEAEDAYFYARLAILAQIVAMLGMALTTFVAFQLGVQNKNYSSPLSLTTLITVCVGFLSAVAWSKSTGQRFESGWEYWPYFCCYFYALIAAIILLMDRLISDRRRFGLTFDELDRLQRFGLPPPPPDNPFRVPGGMWNPEPECEQDQGIGSDNSSPTGKNLPRDRPCDEATPLLPAPNATPSGAGIQGYGAENATGVENGNV